MKHKYTLIILISVFIGMANIVNAYKTVRFVSEFGGKGEELGKISEKTRFAFDKNGNIYVTDEDNMRVQKLDPAGQPVMEIISGEDFLLMRPMDLAVDGEMNIYVVDWQSVQINGTDSPKIFNFGPCVHKFSSDGKYLATFTIEDMTKKAIEIEGAIPALDTDGNFALMIVPEKTDRTLYISVDMTGNIYVLDQDYIFKISSTGEFLQRFGGPGQLNNATDIDVDGKGNIYVADTRASRIVKFSPDGEFLLSFGKMGDSNGRFTGDLSVTTAWDGTILVSDSAKYEKILKTALKHRQVIASSVLVTGQNDPTIPERREFETVIRRFQRFSEDGKFLEKILYRIDKSDPELRNLEFKALDPYGNLYLIEKKELVIYKYSIQNPMKLSEVDKTFTYHIQHAEYNTKIDNLYDLNESVDFLERERYTQMVGTMKFSYDMTERFRVSLAGSLMRLDSTITDKYPGEYADPQGYIQDDQTTDKYTAARARLDFSFILDHDPFEYRVANFFVFFGGGKYDYDINAIDMGNSRRFIWNLWWSTWAAGVNYDMGTFLRLSLIATYQLPGSFMDYKYKYWDEEGKLYSTGIGNGEGLEAFISVEGAF